MPFWAVAIWTALQRTELNLKTSNSDSSHLTAVALCIAKLNSDEVLHPERLADTAARERVALPVAGAVQLTDWGQRATEFSVTRICPMLNFSLINSFCCASCTHWLCPPVVLWRWGSRSSVCAVCCVGSVQHCGRTEEGAPGRPRPGRPNECWEGRKKGHVGAKLTSVQACLRFMLAIHYQECTFAHKNTPVLIECTDLSYNDVAVEYAEQNPDLPQQHVALTVGHLGHGDLQHQLHQVALPQVWRRGGEGSRTAAMREHGDKERERRKWNWAEQIGCRIHLTVWELGERPEPQVMGLVSGCVCVCTPYVAHWPGQPSAVASSAQLMVLDCMQYSSLLDIHSAMFRM